MLGLVARVQPRDIDLLLDLHDKRVLTTHQIADLFFGSARSARGRLLLLYRCGLVERFRPRLDSGSAPAHYLLGRAGAEIVAARLAVDLREVYDKDRAVKLAYSPFLAHLVAVNTFYSRLARAGRAAGLEVEWWGEVRTRRRWGSLVSPDGFGRVATPDSRRVFLELDLGTEPLRRLSAKLAAYDMVAGTEGAAELLLFCFHSPLRETNARKLLHPVGLPIATTHFALHTTDALGAIWLPLGAEARCSLLELPI
ncbi:MAG: replication-relaxation family protein [Actinomycetota bacterium]